MPFQTKSVWNLPVSHELKYAADAKLVDMEQKQVQPVDQSIDGVARQVTRNRYWVDRNSAEEWANFLSPFGPVSIDIIEY